MTSITSVVIQNMPQKLKDLGSFSILCQLDTLMIDKALCDLGASVSLILLSICSNSGIEKIKPTSVTLQMADRSVKFLIGVLKDVNAKVGPPYIPTDFIIMDIKEDPHMPIISGRILLVCIVDTIIDVKKEKPNNEQKNTELREKENLREYNKKVGKDKRIRKEKEYEVNKREVKKYLPPHKIKYKGSGLNKCEIPDKRP
ncbi:uncharacterized protein LOC131648955 [Vicia villosa]|uniref:uncharacterized protein LOC131648955 n=1 Tax=Vicia villosa TaxID=3911 RepID=UPI00273C256C|nr:uncharacterized protein LOC131648955 [Vicia villosa]